MQLNMKHDDTGGGAPATAPPPRSDRAGMPTQASGTTRAPAAQKRGLSNNAINFIVDAILLLAFMAVLTLTAIVQFVLRGTPTAGRTLWSFDRAAWQSAQSASIGVFAVLVLLHLILHWSWVCSFVASRLSKKIGRPIAINESARTIWGVATLIAVLTCMGAVLLAAEFCAVNP